MQKTQVSLLFRLLHDCHCAAINRFRTVQADLSGSIRHIALPYARLGECHGITLAAVAPVQDKLLGIVLIPGELSELQIISAGIYAAVILIGEQSVFVAASTSSS